ncbi:protein lifeguard 1-like [Protopterus annectens]|uniref:protein lifeguard 1-like n=1 Tax=Protopterus annectens TaxID=7888 RepID=UPI001CFB2668|nr:protein lifeguard 1-like [Protopterus annectens]
MDRQNADSAFEDARYVSHPPYPVAPYPQGQPYPDPSVSTKLHSTTSLPQQQFHPYQQGMGYPNQDHFQWNTTGPQPPHEYPVYSPQPLPCYPPANSPSAFSKGPPSAEDGLPEYQHGFENQTEDSFSDKVMRRAFIRKVYITLMIQLAITVGIICIFIYWETARNWVYYHSWFCYALFPITFVLVILFACCDNIRRKVPVNFICLAFFTIVEGMMLGAVSALFGADEVMWAVGATAFVAFGLSLFALQSKWDFTMGLGILWAICLVLLSFGLLCAIIRSYWLNIVYASLGTLIFAIYLVVDTQLMLGGKHKYSLNPEEYIFAALNLYLDIVNIFLFILSIIGLSR